jgi:transketolase
VDINRLGQSEPTMLQHDLDKYEARWRAFGWEVFRVDGHNESELLEAYQRAAETRGRPSVILAHTIKGRGIPGIADKNGYHGKALSEEDAEKAIHSLERGLVSPRPKWRAVSLPVRHEIKAPEFQLGAPPYSPDSQAVATRKAFGEALAELAKVCGEIVVLDGDVKNSTHTESFQKAAGGRFFQMYIAEQNMLGAAMGLAAFGRIPFASTFACFLTRAYDFIRMAAISHSNIKVVGSHCGISIGEDGPSQMGLEDLAMFRAEPDFTILYPSDAVSAWHATALIAKLIGPAYLRTTRPPTPVLYPATAQFQVGQAQVLRNDPDDRVTILGAGVTVFEALKAHEMLLKYGIKSRVIDLFSVQPLDRRTIFGAVRATHNKLVVVEDHYRRGGIGDAVCSAAAEDGVPLIMRHLAVNEIPRSGAREDLFERFGISAAHIMLAAKSIA